MADVLNKADLFLLAGTHIYRRPSAELQLLLLQVISTSHRLHRLKSCKSDCRVPVISSFPWPLSIMVPQCDLLLARRLCLYRGAICSTRSLSITRDSISTSTSSGSTRRNSGRRSQFHSRGSQLECLRPRGRQRGKEGRRGRQQA